MFFDNDYEPQEPDHYTFVYEDDNKGWWLKISNPEDLCYYHIHNSQWSEVLEDYINNNNKGHLSPLTTAIVMYAQHKKLNIIDAIIQFRMNVFTQQCDVIREYGAICINKVGGYHQIGKYSQFVNRKKLIWPDYQSNDLKISRFPDGEHWYIKINDFEVRDGDKIKWDTYEEAFKFAKKFLNDKE